MGHPMSMGMHQQQMTPNYNQMGMPSMMNPSQPKYNPQIGGMRSMPPPPSTGQIPPPFYNPKYNQNQMNQGQQNQMVQGQQNQMSQGQQNQPMMNQQQFCKYDINIEMMQRNYMMHMQQQQKLKEKKD
jgi:hypothetical protein